MFSLYVWNGVRGTSFLYIYGLVEVENVLHVFNVFMEYWTRNMSSVYLQSGGQGTCSLCIYGLVDVENIFHVFME
jgi:hypothetical protein